MNDTTVFEKIRRTNEEGGECWSSRDFAKALGYTSYQHFEQVIGKAQIACENSGQSISHHFNETVEMVSIGSSARRPVKAVLLSRYACYLVIQNADPAKPTIQDLGGTMPEDLPTPDTSIKELEARRRKELEGKAQPDEEI